jgi:hypothetical protein
MNVKQIFEAQDVEASTVHAVACVSTVTALVEMTRARFAQLALEAEPSGFQVQQSRSAP